MILEEQAWCSKDYRYSVITNGFLDRQKFHIVLEMKILNNDKVGIVVCSNAGRERQRVQSLRCREAGALCRVLRHVRHLQERDDSRV